MNDRVIRTEKHVSIVEAHPYHRYVMDDRPAGHAIVERAFDARCPRCREEAVAGNPARARDQLSPRDLTRRAAAGTTSRSRRWTSLA